MKDKVLKKHNDKLLMFHFKYLPSIAGRITCDSMLKSVHRATVSNLHLTNLKSWKFDKF